LCIDLFRLKWIIAIFLKTLLENQGILFIFFGLLLNIMFDVF